jgi:ABC-type uncharacterized transport system substrate-binding protein
LAAKRATATIPIVMIAAGDPLGSGLVANLSQPGGNVTGLSLMASDLGAKRLELLKEVLPRLSRVLGSEQTKIGEGRLSAFDPEADGRACRDVG